ncbi:phosphatidylinositol phosphatase PTPRQ [Ixodes scapularis]
MQEADELALRTNKLKQSWDKVVVVAVPKAPKYSRTLTGLRIGGAYEVRVLVIDSDGKFQETGSLTTKFRTVCGRPTSPPNSVKIDNSSADSVLITWENPPRESWLCWSANVTLEVNGTTESLNLTEPGVNATDRFVVPTRPFTELTVRLRLDTPDGTSSQWTSLWTVRSAEDAPSEVRQLQMTRSFARQASFTWLAPATPNGRIRDYGVVYRPLRPVIPCRVIEQAETKLIVPMSSQRVNLEKLRPYTVYIISVHAVTVKPGPEFSTNFTTEQDVPEGTPTALNYSKKTVDKYEIFWGPVPCELANGVVRHYYLELDSADPWESRLVYAENDAGRSQVAAELNFTTSPAAPPPPSNLTADQLSRTNLSLSWRPPYPPQGVLERYQIKFRTNALRSNSTLLNVDQYQCSSENSDLERHCFTVSNLLPVTIYRFSVRAFNGGTTHGPYSDELEIETGETVPDAPASVRCARREENSLKIQWDEPQRANGILKNYRVNVSLTHSFSSSVNASTRPRAVVLEDLTTREYNLSDLYPGTTYRVCVQASTTAGFGDAVCDLISTRAAGPSALLRASTRIPAKATVQGAPDTWTPVYEKRGPKRCIASPGGPRRVQTYPGLGSTTRMPFSPDTGSPRTARRGWVLATFYSGSVVSPMWLGSLVTLLTKHLAPKVQAPPAGLGVRGDATLQTPAFTDVCYMVSTTALSTCFSAAAVSGTMPETLAAETPLRIWDERADSTVQVPCLHGGWKSMELKSTLYVKMLLLLKSPAGTWLTWRFWFLHRRLETLSLAVLLGLLTNILALFRTWLPISRGTLVDVNRGL